MSRLFIGVCLSLLALPLAALADPVTVTTRSSGVIDPNPGAVYHLGMDLYDDRNGPLPYEMTLSSTFDPEQAGFLEAGPGYWTADADVVMQLQIGAERYRYDGSVDATTSLRVFDGGTGYEQRIGLIPLGTPGMVTFVSNRMDAPVGSGGLFAPRTLSLGAGQGVTRITTFLDDPEAPSLSWEMHAGAASMSLQVASAVPALAPSYALMAGVGTICCWRRRRRRSR